MESFAFWTLSLTLLCTILGVYGQQPQPQTFVGFQQPYANGQQQQQQQHPFGSVFLSQGRVAPYSQGVSGFSSPFGNGFWSPAGSGFSSPYGDMWYGNPQAQRDQSATLNFGNPFYPPRPPQQPQAGSWTFGPDKYWNFGPDASGQSRWHLVSRPGIYQPIGQQQNHPWQNNQGAVPSITQANGKSFCLTPGCVEAAAHLISNINSSADPCEDFHQFACGNWMLRNALPDDKSVIIPHSIISERVTDRLKAQMESNQPLSIGPSNAVNTARKFYKACTDSEALARQRSKPLYDALTSLGSWPILGTPSSGAFDVTRAVSLLTSRYSVSPLWLSWTFDGYSAGNPNDATRSVLKLEQARLNLGAKDTYSDGRPHSADLLRAYQRRIEQSAELLARDAGLNINSADIRAQAANIVEFEKKLARLTKNDEERRNKTLQNNMWTLRDLHENVRVINWDVYFDAILPSDVRQLFRGDQAQVQIADPQFFRDLNNLLSSTDPKTLANYILGSLVWKFSHTLDDRFLDINQEFDRVMIGQPQRSPKSTVCMTALLNPMQHAVGAMFIDKHFTETDKMEASALVRNLMTAMDSIIKEAQWMDDQTKQAALKKLQGVKPLVGYMDFIRHPAQLDEYYKELSFQPGDSHFEMRAKMNSFAQRLQLRKLFKPVDRSEMQMSPAVVNAYYNWEQNNMVLTVAQLQPFFFRGDFPKAVNYGSSGALIGHELTHGFDDTGSQYDELGNLRNWWTSHSARGFEANKRCMVDQYSSYRVDAINMTVNGELTIGENIADNGGLKEAFRAYKIYRSTHGEEPLLPGLNMNNDQVFFTAYASGWCVNMRPQVQIQAVQTDPHSPNQFRIIGPLSNNDDFARAFNCRPGTRMNPVKSSRSKCTVW